MPVIFDFDGVIADTEKLHFEASRLVLAARGVPLDQARYYTTYLGYSDADMAEAIARDQMHVAPGTDVSRFVSEFVRDKGRAYERMIAAGAVLFPGAPACFERLAAAFPLAVASGSFHAEIEHVLNGAGLLHHFSAIVGADDAARSKPHPAPYLEAARRLGADPSDCVAIEDSAWGLESARNAGMKTIAVTNSYPASQLTADWIVESLDAITPESIRRMLEGSRSG